MPFAPPKTSRGWLVLRNGRGIASGRMRSIDIVGRPSLQSIVLVGHRRVTDAHLLALATHNDGHLATFDRGIPSLIEDPAERRRRVEVIAS